ncbi:transcription factor ORG2-like [Bidens hawaiensis]|uniref:transcription factor ORG2-like n=1 Tax=Bidens hawaiensis TaxID=980011 RepID=UPI004049965E
MLALSPPLFYTTYGWPLENITPQNLQHECNNITTNFEANSYNPLVDFYTYNQIQHDFAPENSISVSSEGTTNENAGEPMKMAKKLNHNASERDRRKKVNELYLFLRSLLPMSTDQKKKVSIPQTVSRALKYIPELQKEVEALIRKKEKLSSYSSTSNNRSQDYLRIKKRSDKSVILKRKSSVISSVRVLNEKEAVIQLISSTEHLSKNIKDVGFLSKIVEYFEHEEDVVLLNATTIKGSGEGMTLSTLHFQAQGDKKIETERLKEKLHFFHQQSD